MRWEEKKPQERIRHRKAGTEILSLSQAGDVCSRSVLQRAAGPKSAISHADAGNTPIIVGNRATDKPPKRTANVLVSLTWAIGLEGRRGRPARVEHLGPTAARAEEGEGTLCNGLQKITSHDDTPLQQGLAPRP